MIPVLIAPAYNRHDLLHRMIRSVDVPVGRTLIFDNHLDYPGIPDDLSGSISVVTPPVTSIGYGGAINYGILQTADAPWWLWASNDVEFHPGHLATVVERMNAATGPRIVTGGFTWGAVNRELIDTVGLVDEHSFFPIYYDDNDYHYRCNLAGVEWIEDWATGSTHGEGAGGSITIRFEAEAHWGNGRTFGQNREAYLNKWGGLPGEEKYTSPWNTGWPVWVTRPSVTGRANRRW